MIMKIAAGLIFISLISTIIANDVPEEEEEGERWAVLLASSRTWVHYRHQASICHAYQILHNQGLPDDHIVVIMHDDIAYNEKNPYPGVITDEPGGPNVYEGVPVDYKGSHVTQTTFLKALEGDDTGMADIGSGKVVKSGPNDRIFVVMVDTGGIDHFAFPFSILTAQKLHTHITNMYEAQKFKEMMIFIESSYSGSMILNRYPDEMGVYAMTSTGEFGDSYAANWSEELGTWLGDAFTLAWTKNSEQNDPTKQTIGEQFEQTKQWVPKSTVHNYGNKNITNEYVSAFFGPGHVNYTSKTPNNNFVNLQKDSVRSVDTPIIYLEKHLKSAKDDTEKAHWKEQLTMLKKNRKFLEGIMMKIVHKVTGSKVIDRRSRETTNEEDSEWQCYEQAVEAFHNNCFNLGQNPYGLHTLGSLLNLCENGFTVQEIHAATLTECTFSEFVGIE